MKVARITSRLVMPQTIAGAIIIALAALILATALRWSLYPIVGTGQLPYSTYYPAVLIATLVGGSRSGLLTLIGGGLIGEYLFIEPLYGIRIDSLSELVALLLYLATSAIVVAVAHAYRVTLRELKNSLAERQLLTGEQAHRIRNIVTLAQAIVHNALGRSTEAQTINVRLLALLGSSEQLSAAVSVNKDLKGTIKDALAPFNTERIRIEGTDILLDGETTRTVAIVVHELATNALKYGALSDQPGVVQIIVEHVNRSVVLRWKERERPLTTLPERKGFGLRFLEQLVQQRRGSITFTFATEGLTAEVTLPDAAQTVIELFQFLRIKNRSVPN